MNFEKNNNANSERVTMPDGTVITREEWRQNQATKDGGISETIKVDEKDPVQREEGRTTNEKIEEKHLRIDKVFVDPKTGLAMTEEDFKSNRDSGENM